MSEPVQLLTSDQAAERLAISQSGLRKLVARGVVPAIKLGKSVRFDPRDLAGVVRANRSFKGGSKA